MVGIGFRLEDLLIPFGLCLGVRDHESGFAPIRETSFCGRVHDT